ncbi:predicted protein [Sclerotinia sclerotiorum 1980 UF-70]|uniref:Uncharacterized protein n=1 Tax=Sclerotinia sclerotiorum (strain ATCC 18683 / 1980 / Ss-1) TaxID=665079 RepID=A7EMB5_SCLS1|nr:predicted protein [Sclerotinia sclerotiorum 1980 UF-70]EDO03981.1 predicted protein [Sclerotinia sclerotiorum 1980 UF-70]
MPEEAEAPDRNVFAPGNKGHHHHYDNHHKIISLEKFFRKSGVIYQISMFVQEFVCRKASVKVYHTRNAPFFQLVSNKQE